MKSKKIIRLLAVLFGCWQSFSALGQEEKKVEAGKKVREWGQEQEGFRLSIQTDKSNYRTDEGIILTISLQNHGKEARSLSYKIQEIVVKPPQDYATADFVIHESKDSKQAEKAAFTKEGARWKVMQGETGVSIMPNIKPGHGRVDRLMLNQIYDMTYWGEYKISVKVAIPSFVKDGHEEDEGGAGKNITLTSNEISVMVQRVDFPVLGVVEIPDQ